MWCFQFVFDATSFYLSWNLWYPLNVEQHKYDIIDIHIAFQCWTAHRIICINWVPGTHLDLAHKKVLYEKISIWKSLGSAYLKSLHLMFSIQYFNSREPAELLLLIKYQNDKIWYALDDHI